MEHLPHDNDLMGYDPDLIKTVEAIFNESDAVLHKLFTRMIEAENE